MIILKGFPTTISEEVELPDMSELLMYPYFYDTDLEDAYKYATSFQRKLIDMCPIDNSKNSYSLLSQVRVLMPEYRSCTGGGGSNFDPNDEWHIDNEENEDTKYVYNEERDIVTLLTNKTSAMTQFNKNEIKINLPIETLPDFNHFSAFLQKNFKAGNPLGIEAQDMPANRLVTFTNHLHRASEPTQIEFRYMFRLVQTNRKRKPIPYNPSENISNILNLGNPFLNIDRSLDSVSIYYPTGFKDYFKEYESSKQEDIIEEKKESNKTMSGNFNEYDFYFSTPLVADIETLEFTKAEYGVDFLSSSNVLKSFANPNPIFLFNNQDFGDVELNKKYLDFLSVVDKNIEFISPDGEILQGKIEQDFYNIDDTLGPISGGIAYLKNNASLVPGVEYTIKTNTDVKYHFSVKDGLKLVRK